MMECLDPIKVLKERRVGRVDLFICLSGRGTFEGKLTKADQKKFKQNGRECDLSTIDTHDTLDRMKKTISLAKLYYKQTGRYVPIYFNGVKEQNDQFRSILEIRDYYQGYPAKLFIINDIPLDNTVGQCIALRYFVEKNPGIFQSNRPHLFFVSSTFHMTRVSYTFGLPSPLLSAEFYHQNPGITDRISQPVMKTHVFQKSCFMQRANMHGYGLGLMITQRGWKKDIYGDMQAIIKYSLIQNPPSIASIARGFPNNWDTKRDAITSQSATKELFLTTYHLRIKSDMEASLVATDAKEDRNNTVTMRSTLRNH